MPKTRADKEFHLGFPVTKIERTLHISRAIGSNYARTRVSINGNVSDSRGMKNLGASGGKGRGEGRGGRCTGVYQSSSLASGGIVITFWFIPPPFFLRYLQITSPANAVSVTSAWRFALGLGVYFDNEENGFPFSRFLDREGPGSGSSHL